MLTFLLLDLKALLTQIVKAGEDCILWVEVRKTNKERLFRNGMA